MSISVGEIITIFCIVFSAGILYNKVSSLEFRVMRMEKYFDATIVNKVKGE